MVLGVFTQFIEQLAASGVTTGLGGLQGTGIAVHYTPTAMAFGFPVGTGLPDLRIA